MFSNIVLSNRTTLPPPLAISLFSPVSLSVGEGSPMEEWLGGIGKENTNQDKKQIYIHAPVVIDYTIPVF